MLEIDDNLIFLSDLYKVGHWPQYPAGTSNIYSYFESRGGKFETTTFAGLQFYLKRYFQKVPTLDQIEEADELFGMTFGTNKLFNREGWIKLNKLGYMPLHIKAVPEGMSVPTRNILMSFENTHPDFFWLTNYLETLSVMVWYPTTVATYSREIKKLCLRYLRKNGTPENIDFMLNDFGVRGSTSTMSAAIGGFAHLINFKGTDNIPALVLCRRYYNEPCAGFSIPASEHSTITSWTQDGECDAMENMINVYGDQPMYACVSDSYDIYRACREYWGGKLKNKVLNAKGKLIVRPDSGDPIEVDLEVLKILGDRFDSRINSKGYRLLNPKVGMIQGDGVNYFSIHDILEEMDRKGWSADNIAFGSGGDLLQKHDRDECKFAFKAACAVVNNFEVPVFKQPITDNGKMSKRGYQSLVMKANGELKTVDKKNAADDILKTVFKDGELKFEQTMADIRTRANVGV